VSILVRSPRNNSRSIPVMDQGSTIPLKREERAGIMYLSDRTYLSVECQDLIRRFLAGSKPLDLPMVVGLWQTGIAARPATYTAALHIRENFGRIHECSLAIASCTRHPRDSSLYVGDARKELADSMARLTDRNHVERDDIVVLPAILECPEGVLFGSTHSLAIYAIPGENRLFLVGISDFLGSWVVSWEPSRKRIDKQFIYPDEKTLKVIADEGRLAICWINGYLSGERKTETGMSRWAKRVGSRSFSESDDWIYFEYGLQKAQAGKDIAR